MSTFAADGSEYSSKESDYDEDDEAMMGGSGGGPFSEGGESPTVELEPVPNSKNSGNRFVVFVWDRLLDTKGRDVLDLHYDRIDRTEDHVMYCRKANLYNETFNADSMVDVMWSYPILASDLKRVIGHAMCLESTKLEYVQEFLSKEPYLQSLTGGDLTNVPLYRWRHIRDYSLRQDDGRFGCPAMMLAMDHDAEEGIGNIRTDMNTTHLEYLIRSERVIAAGSLHLPTEFKDDPASSMAVGDLILFNAKDRDAAIEFAESDPYAQAGLYQNMRVHFYNSLDVTGKFVSEDELRDAPCEQMKEALEVWGYPVHDDQTPWLNC